MTKPLAFTFKRNTGSKVEGEIKKTYPIIYYPMNETSGNVMYNYGSIGPNANGTYGAYRVSVKLADSRGPGGGLAPFFYGSGSATCYLSPVPLSSFRTTFNGQIGTLGVWAKVSGSAWTDSSVRQAVYLYDGAGQNALSISKTATDNVLSCLYIANATSKQVTSASSYANSNWNFLTMTYSLSASQMKGYINGVQVGSTQTGLGTFTNNSTISFRIGDYYAGNSIWKGWLSHVTIWNRVLNVSEMQNIYKAGTA